MVGVKRAAPALVSLPAPGRLLVTGATGPWVVHQNGAKRRLGSYAGAGWSPHGLFVIATRGRELVAVDPKGNVRWTLTRRQPVRLPSWSPDGYRIAYLAGSALHVVAGDSTGDHTIAGWSPPSAPAWRPNADHVVSVADRQGRISTYAADTGRLLWRARPPQPPKALAWAPDGSYLLSAGRSSLTLYGADGSPARQILGPGAAPISHAAFSPDSRAIAFTQRTARGSTLAPGSGSSPRSAQTQPPPTVCSPAEAASPTSPGHPTATGSCSPGKAPTNGCSSAPPTRRSCSPSPISPASSTPAPAEHPPSQRRRLVLLDKRKIRIARTRGTPPARPNVPMAMRGAWLLIALVLATASPGAGRAAGCSPLDCAPSQIPLAGGKLLAVRARGIDGNIRVLDLQTGSTRWWLPPA